MLRGNMLKKLRPLGVKIVRPFPVRHFQGLNNPGNSFLDPKEAEKPEDRYSEAGKLMNMDVKTSIVELSKACELLFVCAVLVCVFKNTPCSILDQNMMMCCRLLNPCDVT